MNITETLSAFGSTLELDHIPAGVTERACLLIADSVGVAIRARKEAESTPALLAAVEQMGMADGDGRVFVDSRG